MKSDRDLIKIVYLIGQLDHGGTEQQLLLLAKYLDRQRFQPHVISLAAESGMADRFSELGIPVSLLGRPKNGRGETLFQLVKQLRKIRPAIVHSFGFAGRLGMVAVKLLGSTAHVCAVRTDPNWESALGRVADRIVFRTCDSILVNSVHSLALLQNSQRISPARTRLVYNGLNLSEFDRSANASSASPDENLPHTSDDVQVICSVASLKEIKGSRELIEAFAITHRAFEKVELWLVGDGPQKNELHEIAERLGVRDRVLFLGLRNDIPGILRRATIGVNSSFVEGLSNAIIEYLAAGLPVVATAVGGNPELVRDGETGLLVPPGDPERLAHALLKLLQNRELARRLGGNGRALVEQLFSAERMVAETQLAYQEIIAAKRTEFPNQLLGVVNDGSAL